MTEHELHIGDRVRWTARATYRRGDWPDGVWVRDGITYDTTIRDLYDEIPAYGHNGELYPASPAWAVLDIDGGATVAAELHELS